MEETVQLSDQEIEDRQWLYAQAVGGPFGWINDPTACNKALTAAIRVIESFKLPQDGAQRSVRGITPESTAANVCDEVVTENAYSSLRKLLGDLINRLPAATEPRSQPAPEQ